MWGDEEAPRDWDARLVDSPSADSSATSSPGSSVQSPPPHTPLFSPSSSSSGLPSPADLPDLPEALVQEGWRRAYSSREQRHYYFNKHSQQSLWEMPPGRKRAHSPAHPADAAAQPFKKFIPSSDWDLRLESNVHMGERPPLSLLPTSASMERRRAEAVAKLRATFGELRDGAEAPPDWWARWVMERKLVDVGGEALLPGDCGESTSALLLRDLQACVPIRSRKIRSIPEARKEAGKYAEAAKRMAETSQLSNDQRKQVKWQCQAMFDFLRQSAGNTKFEEFLNRLKFLKSQCGEILSEAAGPSLEGVCRKLQNSAADLATSLQESQREELEACGIALSSDALPAPRADKVVRCYPAQLRYPTPRSQATVAMDQSPSGYVKLTLKSATQPEAPIKINAAHFFKLEQMYRLSSFDDRRFDLFLPRVWCLLRRYQCLYGAGADGCAQQRSLPVPVFEVLKRDFGATFEAYASPLNSYFRQFCSLFPDTDGFFGSRGPWESFLPVDGSFVVHPPFAEELAESAAVAALARLAASDRPLSFFFVLPEWEDPPLKADALLQAEAGLLRRRVRVAAYDVCWRHGAQQWMASQSPDFLQRAPQGFLLSSQPRKQFTTTGIILYWVQNDAGAERWPVTDENVASVLTAFKPPPALQFAAPPSPSA